MHESTESLNAAQTGRKVLYDNGYLRYYSGTRPVNVAAGLGGATLLAENRFAATAFGSPSGGVLTAAAITGANATQSGTVSFAAAFKSDGTTIISLHDVGLAGSGAECIADSLSATSGLAFNTTSMTLTQPDGAYGS